MSVRGTVGLALAACIALTLVACETNETPVGMTRDNDGTLVAVIHPCRSNTTVSGITVTDLETHRVLWQVSSDVGTSERSFALGQAPPGFVESVPLSAEPRTRIQVTFRTSELPDEYGNADPTQAQSGSILVDGKQVSEEAFNSRNTCG